MAIDPLVAPLEHHRAGGARPRVAPHVDVLGVVLLARGAPLEEPGVAEERTVGAGGLGTRRHHLAAGGVAPLVVPEQRPRRSEGVDRLVTTRHAPGDHGRGRGRVSSIPCQFGNVATVEAGGEPVEPRVAVLRPVAVGVGIGAVVAVARHGRGDAHEEVRDLLKSLLEREGVVGSDGVLQVGHQPDQVEAAVAHVARALVPAAVLAGEVLHRRLEHWPALGKQRLGLGLVVFGCERQGRAAHAPDADERPVAVPLRPVVFCRAGVDRGLDGEHIDAVGDRLPLGRGELVVHPVVADRDSLRGHRCAEELRPRVPGRPLHDRLDRCLCLIKILLRIRLAALDRSPQGVGPRQIRQVVFEAGENRLGATVGGGRCRRGRKVVGKVEVGSRDNGVVPGLEGAPLGDEGLGPGEHLGAGENAVPTGRHAVQDSGRRQAGRGSPRLDGVGPDHGHRGGERRCPADGPVVVARIFLVEHFEVVAPSLHECDRRRGLRGGRRPGIGGGHGRREGDP